MQKIYSRINWENFPSEKTAVNESNLNKMDLAIDNLDDRVVAMDASKVDLTKANELVKEILWDESNGTLTVVKMNGSRAVIDTKLEKLAVNFTYNPQTQQLVIALDDGTVQNVDLSSLITEYEFLDSDTIAFEIAGGKVKAIVKNGSITENHLAPEYLAEIRTQVGRAEMSAKSADASEKSAVSSSALAKSYAVGGTGTREGEDTDNAKYYAEQAKNASDVGALSKIVDNHISDKIVHMTESEHGVVSKLGESAEGSLTYNGSEIKPSVATTESTGVVKPDGTTITIDEDGTLHGVAKATVDDTISSESTNPVQNKVVKAYVDKKASENVDFSTSTSKLLNDSIEAQLVLSNATRNLLNPKLATTTINGITCTNNGDGTYTFNGTATDNVFFDINRNIQINKGTKYKVVCFKDEDYIPNKIRSCVRRVDTNTEYVYNNGSFVSDTENCWIWVEIAKDVTVSNLVAKPMITTDLNATYDDFVPYSGYDIKTCGKNLFKNYDNYGVYEVATETYNGNSVIYSSKDWSGAYQSDLILKKGKTYAISAYVKGSGRYFIYCNQINEGGQSVGIEVEKDLNSEWTKITKVYTPNFDVHKVRLEVRGGSLYISCFQIEESAQSTDYEQYQDGGTVHIDSTTEFPLLGLKSFDGETNIISPGNVEVTYAKSDSGKAILDMSENKLDKDNVVNNQTTTEEGFALDARQANPNIDGTLAKQVSDLNGSLKNDINTLNPSGAIRLYTSKAIGDEGAGWYRFAKITCDTDTIAKGSTYIFIETLIRQSFSNTLGCFHKIDFYLMYSDSARISVTGHNSDTLKKVRIVRNDNKIFLDVYSVAIINSTEILSFIPFNEGIQSAERVEAYLVPEISDGEVIVCSVDLANNI